MIPIGATDPKSGVYQGRENTGEATVFNSGNFDPVSFHARRAEIARLESDKLREEKKKKLANMNLLENYNPASQKGSEEIYKTFGDASKAFAEAAAQGLDFEDPTLPIGQQWIQLQGELKGKIAGDKQVNDWLTQGADLMARNPSKYDAEVFQQTYDAVQKAPTIAERVKIMQTMPLLAPDYDPNILLKQIKAKPNIMVEKIEGGKRRAVATYSPEVIQAQIEFITGNPENKPYLDKYQKELESGQRTIPFARMIEDAMRRDEFAKESFAPQGRVGGSGATFNFGGIGVSNDNWSFTAMDENSTDEFIVSSPDTATLGGQNPAITIYDPTDGKRKKGEYSQVYKNANGEWIAVVNVEGTVETTNKETGEKVRSKGIVTREVPFSGFNYANFWAETGLDRKKWEKSVGYNSTSKTEAKPKPTTNEKLSW